MKKILSLLLVAVMVLSMTACGKNNADETTDSGKSSKKTTEATTEAVPLTPNEQAAIAWEKSLDTVDIAEEPKAGSLTISLDGEKLGELFMGMALPLTADLTLAADPAKEAGRLSLSAMMDGSAFLDLMLGYEDKAIVIGSEQILGEKIYGLNLANIRENLEQSIFNPAQGGDYVLPEEIYSQIIEALGSIPTASDTDETAEKLEAVIEDFLDTLQSTLNKNLVSAESDEEITVNGKSVKTHVLSWTADSKALAAIENDLKAWAKDNAALKEAVDALGGMTQGASAITGSELDLSPSIQDWAASETKYEETDALQLALYVNEKSGEIVRGAAKITSGTEPSDTFVTVDLSNEKDKAFFSMEIKENKDVMTLTVSSESTADKLDLQASMKMVGENEADNEELNFSLTWSASDNVFKAEVKDQLLLTGTCEKKDKVTTVIPQSLTIGSGEDAMTLEDFGIVITLTEEAELPALAPYQELLALKGEELEELVNNIIDMIGSLIG